MRFIALRWPWHMTWVTVSEALDRGLRLDSCFACQLLQRFWLQISAVFPTFNSLTTIGYLLEVFLTLWITSMVYIFTSASVRPSGGPTHLPLSYPSAEPIFKNRLHQLITCSQNLTTPKGIIDWQRVNQRLKQHIKELFNDMNCGDR